MPRYPGGAQGCLYDCPSAALEKARQVEFGGQYQQTRVSEKSMYQGRQSRRVRLLLLLDV
jgi:hypothetical protein